MHFADDPEFTYLAFPIGSWQRVMPHSQNKNEATMQSFQECGASSFSVNAIFGKKIGLTKLIVHFLATL